MTWFLLLMIEKTFLRRVKFRCDWLFRGSFHFQPMCRLSFLLSFSSSPTPVDGLPLLDSSFIFFWFSSLSIDFSSRFRRARCLTIFRSYFRKIFDWWFSSFVMIVSGLITTWCRQHAWRADDDVREILMRMWVDRGFSISRFSQNDADEVPIIGHYDAEMRWLRVDDVASCDFRMADYRLLTHTMKHYHFFFFIDYYFRWCRHYDYDIFFILRLRLLIIFFDYCDLVITSQNISMINIIDAKMLLSLMMWCISEEKIDADVSASFRRCRWW